MKGVFRHPEKVRTTGAIGGTEARHFPAGNLLQGGSQFTFEVVSCPDRHGPMKLSPGSQIINMPEKVFPLSPVSLQSLRQVLLR
jgi:hypothetical protein